MNQLKFISINIVSKPFTSIFEIWIFCRIFNYDTLLFLCLVFLLSRSSAQIDTEKYAVQKWLCNDSSSLEIVSCRIAYEFSSRSGYFILGETEICAKTLCRYCKIVPVNDKKLSICITMYIFRLISSSWTQIYLSRSKKISFSLCKSRYQNMPLPQTCQIWGKNLRCLHLFGNDHELFDVLKDQSGVVWWRQW